LRHEREKSLLYRKRDSRKEDVMTNEQAKQKALRIFGAKFTCDYDGAAPLNMQYVVGNGNLFFGSVCGIGHSWESAYVNAGFNPDPMRDGFIEDAEMPS
jgi:hypothetical protein